MNRPVVVRRPVLYRIGQPIVGDAKRLFRGRILIGLGRDLGDVEKVVHFIDFRLGDRELERGNGRGGVGW